MAVSYVGVGTQSTGAGGNRGPSLPSGMIEDDFMLCAASARTDAGLYTHPVAGWSSFGPYRSGNKNTLQHFYKFHDGSESVSALQYTQGEDGSAESQAAQYAAFRGVDQSTPYTVGNRYTETSVQDITWGEGVTVPNGGAVIYVGHKTDNWTEVATFSGGSLTWVEIGEPDTTTGNDAGMVWGYALNNTGSSVVVAGTGTAAVTGGAIANTLAYFIVLNPQGAASVSGSGAATLAVTGTGAGSHVTGTGAAMLVITGTGEGSGEGTGSGAMVLTISATGQGSHVTGTGSATLTISGSGVGWSGQIEGSGALVLSITGTGAGVLSSGSRITAIPTSASSTTVTASGAGSLTATASSDAIVEIAGMGVTFILGLSGGDYLVLTTGEAIGI